MTFPSYRAALFAAVSLCAAGSPALAESAVPLADSVVPFASTVQVLGEADPASIVHFQVALKLRDYAGLYAGNLAHTVLTPAELEARHLPTRADHDAVVGWLRSQGLTIDATIPSRLAILASGRADIVSRALGVHLSHIASEGQDFVAADSVPSIPASLAVTVLGINGLQPQLHAHTMHTLQPLAVSPLAKAKNKPPFYPSEILSGYSATGLGTGVGTTTAIIIDVLPKTTDLTTFWNTTGVAQSLSNITLIQVVGGTPPALSGEESLDTEYSSSMGAASKVRVYASHDLSYANLDIAFQRVISDLQGGTKITQVSISLGGCETTTPQNELTTDDGYFATMTSLGASVFASSGDSGAHECGGKALVPSFFGTSPNLAQVGGTTLHLNTTSGKESSETSWNSSGGGISQVFAKPAYQSGLSYSMRAGPDLSADANPSTGVFVVENGKTYQFGGTSVSSPVTAGLMGLVNASRISAGKSTLGLLDSRIYPLLGTTSFRDIISGNNGYPAGPGYDLVTGIGAPVMSVLLPVLAGQN